ncbi:hypothetical protein L9F63_002659, partial [Diploptera punctata]
SSNVCGFVLSGERVFLIFKLTSSRTSGWQSEMRTRKERAPDGVSDCFALPRSAADILLIQRLTELLSTVDPRTHFLSAFIICLFAVVN